MKNFHDTPIRLALTTTLVVCLALLAACSSNVGPSNDKMRLDVLDRLNQRYHGLLDIDQFTIDDRNQLSEDRIQFHATASYKLDSKRVSQAEQADRVLPGYNAALERARRSTHGTEPMTLVYRRTGDDIWQLARILPGHQ